MGDHAEARQMLQEARADYVRCGEALRGFAGELALVRAMEGAGEVMGI